MRDADEEEAGPVSEVGLGDLITALLKHWTAVTAAVGATMYATVWLGYRAMYRAVGVAPAAVGLDQPAIIATTAVALALTAAPAALALVLGYGLARRFGSEEGAGAGLNELRALGWAVAVSAVSGPPLIYLGLVPFLYQAPYAPFVLTAQFVLAGVGFATVGYLRGRTTVDPGSGRLLASVWVAAAILAILAFSGFVIVRATELGQGVARGDPTVEERTFFFVLRSSPVCAAVEDGAPEYVLYVGDDGQRAVLIDPVRRIAIRRSLEGMTLTHLLPTASAATPRDLSGLLGDARQRCAGLAAHALPEPSRSPRPDD